MRKQIRQNVVPMFVPSASWRLGIAAQHNSEFRIRRVRREIFIGINTEAGWMIHREQSHLIEVNGFFQRLHEAKAELAILFANRISIKFYVFHGTRNVALSRPNPVPDDSRTKHVCDKLVPLTIPYK